MCGVGAPEFTVRVHRGGRRTKEGGGGIVAMRRGEQRSGAHTLDELRLVRAVHEVLHQRVLALGIRAAGRDGAFVDGVLLLDGDLDSSDFVVGHCGGN